MLHALYRSVGRIVRRRQFTTAQEVPTSVSPATASASTTWHTPATKDGIPNIYFHHHLDTARWKHFKPRDDDIFVCTSMKCGTTWTQTIVGNLIFQGQTPADSFWNMSPWFDMRLFPLEAAIEKLEAQTHRRFIKTHAAMDNIAHYEQCKYIYVGRDFRDVTMSMWNHYSKMKDSTFKLQEAAEPKYPPCPKPTSDDIHDFITPYLSRGWFDFESDGYPFWSNCHHLQSFFDFRHLENMYFVHYSDLLNDLGGEMRKLAVFLDIPIQEEHFEGAVENCTFKSMQESSEKDMALAEEHFYGGAKTFVYKGTNMRWKGVFTEAELDLYEKLVSENLSPEARAWIERPDG